MDYDSWVEFKTNSRILNVNYKGIVLGLSGPSK